MSDQTAEIEELRAELSSLREAAGDVVKLEQAALEKRVSPETFKTTMPKLIDVLASLLDPPSPDTEAKGTDAIKDAIRQARGGEPPVQPQGWA